jgi:hypothetical protein
MRLLCSAVLALGFLTCAGVRAQTPSGAIVGGALDSTGAIVAGARVEVVHNETGQSRHLTTSGDGRYTVEALLPGSYRVTVDAAGFKRLERMVMVEAGTTTTVDLALQVGGVTETVTVSGAAPLLRHDHHQIAGLVGRGQIENLPLNGRNFLELAKLEPGVTNPTRLNDNRTFVSFLGAGLQTIPRVGYTRVTIDGANVVTPGTAGVLFQVSQDVVQEFQIATVNFDSATSLASNGAINIVTRSGGNEYRGVGFAYHRDHRLAAYPALRRDPANPHPSFRRDQFGFQLGGPIRRERAFFSASYERTDQRGVISVQPRTPEFASLGGIFSAPYTGDQLSVRSDLNIRSGHNAFARYTRDINRALAGGANVLPSAWQRRTNEQAQAVGGVTSVLSDNVVNDVRVSYFSFDTASGPPASRDCPGCFGLGASMVRIPDAAIAFGNADTFSFGGRRYQLTESLLWQRGSHRLRFGFDWEHVTNTQFDVREPARITLWAPARVRQLAPTIPLPATFTTVADILRLPLLTMDTSVGPGGVSWRDFSPRRVVDLYRLYASDTWRIASRLTVNGGVAWSYEPNALNHDLTKPVLLAPILGVDGLKPPKAQLANFSPSVGFAWTPTADGKTVVRGGAGRYFDPAASTNYNNLANERLQLAPAGTGRIDVTGEGIAWGSGTLEFGRQPTAFTGADLLAILPAIRAGLLASRTPGNRDFATRNIDLRKSGENLYDPSYKTPYAIHLGLGVQRELARDFVVSADVVWKRFIHTFINGIDYNRWNSVRGPIVPACSAEQRENVAAVCSSGNLYFDTTIGRARYRGLLVRAEKRYSRGTQFLVSYALGSYVGTNGTGTGTSENPGGRVFGFNNDDWFENYGPLPTDQRHVLNVAGFIDLPWQLQLAFSTAVYSRPPFAPYVLGVDFNGDGTRDDLLPGTRVNQFGRGLDASDLEQLVSDYNREFAGRMVSGGQTAPALTLPATYSLDDSFFTQDVRVARSVSLGADRVRMVLFGEVFNVFNTANLVQFSGNLANTATFGQPGSRFAQVFGSGGPRAVQFGARLSF